MSNCGKAWQSQHLFSTIFGRNFFKTSGRRWSFPLVGVAAARAGWRIAEVDVDYALRTAGTHSKVTGTVRGTARAVRDMAKVLAG